MTAWEWVLQKGPDTKFPFRVLILEDGSDWLALRAQGRWPGGGKQVSCLREQAGADVQDLEEIVLRSRVGGEGFAIHVRASPAA